MYKQNGFYKQSFVIPKLIIKKKSGFKTKMVVVWLVREDKESLFNEYVGSVAQSEK